MKVKCWICGSFDVVSHQTIINGAFFDAKHQERWRCYCAECKKKTDAEYDALKEEYIRLKKEVMFENAIETLEGQNINIYDYKEAIEAIHDYIRKYPDKFDSSYEVIAAIILIYNKVQCKPQAAVGKYRVDFLLPDEYVVLEIDGERHKARKRYDSDRDIAIKAELGEFWEIVRIDTDLLKTNAKELVKAIRKICEYRIFGNHGDIYRS